MSRDQVTAEAVMQAVLHRITTGQYAPGDRLPPVRKLAEEIGSNRNTVNKAYQMLFELGIIENNDIARKGYTVKRAEHAGSKTKTELLDYFYQHSVELVWQGMAAGMSSEDMLSRLKAAVDEVFGHSEVSLIFYECNDYDTTEMGRHLNEILHMPVEFRNLSHFYKNPGSIVKKYDLIITTYHHLSEITEAIKRMEFPSGKVVGIDTRLTADSMLKIARFPKTSIGVICTNQNTAHMIKHILFGYHPEWEIEAIASEDPQAIAALASRCDHLIVTHTSAEEVNALTGRSPDVVVNFQIDEQSIAFLNQRIHQIRMEKVQAHQSNPVSTNP
ncbi:MAG: GntR family transcriptional regulator [Anaerolineae bacterium]|nr:GntR family transcriptional regulator [Anaerolineae bacterium]